MQEILTGPLVADGVDHRMLALIVDDIAENYLARWEVALARVTTGWRQNASRGRSQAAFSTAVTTRTPSIGG